MTLLIVGLGNFGREYIATRHNVGFMIVDRLVRDVHASPEKKFKSEFYMANIEGEKVLFLKPLTYMNLSGEAVVQCLSYYKLANSSLVVIHDDIDLPVGKIKVKCGGGSGGHNGLRSIDKIVGSDYLRIRVGVDHPRNSVRPGQEVDDYVLSKFHEQEMEVIDDVIETIAGALPVVISLDQDKISRNLQLFNK